MGRSQHHLWRPSAIRWYEIDESNNNVKQLGTIGDVLHDYYYPSLAVNQFGDVVIGYTRSGETEFASAYASIGETVNNVTTFGDPNFIESRRR